LACELRPIAMKLAADGRPSARKRGYTVRWEKAARRFLNKHLTCARFGIDPKCRGLAAEVDHIRAHNGDLRLFWARSNWQGLCKPCHSRKTLAERRAKPVQNRWDLDGMPLDPAHHWNKV
jgi:5-methylcytosine-specific restriction enzyme A